MKVSLSKRLEKEKEISNLLLDFDDSNFVECTVCPDYDLCLVCLAKQNHGHDLSHGFRAATEDTVLSSDLKLLLAPGKNFRHYAICDGCDKVR